MNSFKFITGSITEAWLAISSCTIKLILSYEYLQFL